METILRLTDFSPALIADSGQCFRWRPLSKDTLRLVAMGRVLTVRTIEPGVYGFSAEKKELDDIWLDYFDLKSDYTEYKSLILPGDDFLKEAVRQGEGIRILRQEPFETLISFIISQRKSVPAIRKCVEFLAGELGEELKGGEHAFPAPEALYRADTATLKAAGLGYRVPYVREAAGLVARGDVDLGALSMLDTESLLKKLTEFPGVGIKVAGCTALFSYHRLNVVPVDIWMRRVLDTVYGGSMPGEYAGAQGVLHQYMYNYARKAKIGT